MKGLAVKKLIFLLFIIFVISFFVWNQFRCVSPKCGLKHEFLCERIWLFYTRNSWWDDMLCEDTKMTHTGRNFSDLIPLRILYREVWPETMKSTNIFFVENNCKLTLAFYVQCALESAAVQNPNSTIYLLTVIPILEDGLHTIRNLLNRFPNIQIVQADYDSIFQNTPLESYRSTTRWTNNADFVKPHMSDALRTAILWKEGGAYIDADIVSLKPLPSEANVLVLDQDNLHNCFMKFNKHHKALIEIMSVQNSSYDGTWISMGPRPVTKGVSTYCNETINKVGKYKDIMVLPYGSFNPIAWDKTEEFLRTPPSTNLSEVIKTSYGFHTSHYMVGEKLNEIGKDNLYDLIVREYCPYSYNQYHH